ncbi:hypothetical protein BLX88_23720 [Bacillus obstructivus]|nr:hypothetical protein BLX88_23720 [Bacillus obstructivus]
MGQRTHFHSGLRAKDHESFLSEMKEISGLRLLRKEPNKKTFLIMKKDQKIKKPSIFMSVSRLKFNKS